MKKTQFFVSLFYLYSFISIVFKILSTVLQDYLMNLLTKSSLLITVQIIMILFLFGYNNYERIFTIINLAIFSLIGTIGIGLDLFLFTVQLGQNSTLITYLGLEWLFTFNFFLIWLSFFLLTSNKQSKLINPILFIVALAGFVSVFLSSSSIIIDPNRTDSLFSLLIGMQSFLLINFIHTKNHNHSVKSNISEIPVVRKENFQIALIIPAYNEEKLISKTLSTIPEVIQKIYVVNDGSSDQTVEIVSRIALTNPRVELINHTENRGVGAAIQTGYMKAYQEGYDILAVIGADAQMELEDLQEFFQPIMRGEADYVKGNRFTYKKPFSKGNAFREMPPIRIFGNILCSIITIIGSGYIGVFDTQMGYTAIHRDVIPRIAWYKARKGYGYPGDWLCRFHPAGVRVKDVPTKAIYLSEENQSKIQVKKYLFYTSWTMLKAYSWRIRQEYLTLQNFKTKNLIPQFWFFYAILMLPLTVITSVISITPITWILLGLQSVFFFILSDLVSDDLSISSNRNLG